MPLMWNNPNVDVKKTFISSDQMAVYLYLFQLDKAGCCPQLEETGIVNRAVAKCLSRWLLRKGFVGWTPAYEGQRSIEKQVETLILEQFLGMRIGRIRRAGLGGMGVEEIISASRKDGDNRRCHARKSGMACYGLRGVQDEFRAPAVDVQE